MKVVTQLKQLQYAKNNFKDNWFSNLTKVSNKEFMNSSNCGGAYSSDVNNLFEPGIYGMNNNDNLPGDFKYGVLEVNTITKRKGAYLTNSDISNISYCHQKFITSEGYPKVYERIYNSGSWKNWQRVTTTNME